MGNDVRFRVLSVDDSSAIHGIVFRFLKNTEFDLVATARDGREAVERFKETDPDILMLDVIMPGSSGREVLREILALKPGLPVGMVSSLGTEDVIRECLQGGARSFLQKPFKQADLLAFLRRLAAPAAQAAS